MKAKAIKFCLVSMIFLMFWLFTSCPGRYYSSAFWAALNNVLKYNKVYLLLVKDNANNFTNRLQKAVGYNNPSIWHVEIIYNGYSYGCRLNT